ALVNPALLHGWGVRPNDWQWGVNLRHEVIPRVSVEFGYNRRYFRFKYGTPAGQGTVTDNLLVSPSAYEKWPLNAPVDSRLPGGGGYPITMYTMTAAAAARGASNYITTDSDYGAERTDYWHGLDMTLNARLPNSLNLQIGTSTGRGVTNNCATQV